MWNTFKLNNKNTITTSMTLLWFFLLTLNVFYTYFLLFLLLALNNYMLAGNVFIYLSASVQFDLSTSLRDLIVTRLTLCFLWLVQSQFLSIYCRLFGIMLLVIRQSVCLFGCVFKKYAFNNIMVLQTLCYVTYTSF